MNHIKCPNMHSLSNKVTVVKNLDEVIAASDFLTVHVPLLRVLLRTFKC